MTLIQDVLCEALPFFIVWGFAFLWAEFKARYDNRKAFRRYELERLSYSRERMHHIRSFNRQ